MDYIIKYLYEVISISNEMSPYLLFGFLIAGILFVGFSPKKIYYYLGKKNITSVIKASLIGIPLPLCSCGVIPTGISLYKNGASKGSSVSFLISTPQTGVDSILITYSLLGLPFAIIRPIIALITGFLGGFFTNILDIKNNSESQKKQAVSNPSKVKQNIFYRLFRYAFVEFLEDIAKWLIIGLLIAAAISVIIPDNFFTTYLSNSYLNMLVMLIAAIPLYVCATASVPIAAVLLLKGISPGAALVFLMAGPATNAATITIISKVFGKSNLLIYLATIIASAFIFGILINEFVPHSYFTNNIIHNLNGSHSDHEILPYWIKVSSSIILGLLIINTYFQKYLKNQKSKRMSIGKQEGETNELDEIKVTVTGMTCNHCKMNVENNLKNIKGIDNAVANLQSSTVQIRGKDFDLEKIKNTVEKLGYNYIEKNNKF